MAGFPPEASVTHLLGSFQLLEASVVAAESLSLRLPGQLRLVQRLLQNASNLASSGAACSESLTLFLSEPCQFRYNLSSDVLESIKASKQSIERTDGPAD